MFLAVHHRKMVFTEQVWPSLSLLQVFVQTHAQTPKHRNSPIKTPHIKNTKQLPSCVAERAKESKKLVQIIQSLKSMF